MEQAVCNVSVILPVLNEEKYIEACIQSLLSQDYPRESMEWIFVDGGSSDRTIEIIQKYQNDHSGLIRILDNPRRTQACAMNVGIAEAKGQFVIRMDAHSAYAADYITQCIRLLETGKYDNVGGIACTEARTEYGRVIAKMVSSRFGVGNSQFRTGTEAGPADTVPFGAFRKDLFDRIGGFDERLDRNEDNEINYRIRKNGGVVYLSPDIRFTYYPRETFGGICNMAFQNGKWSVIASRMCPGSMRLRHWIPFLFVLSLILLPILSLLIPAFKWVLRLECAAYLLLDIVFAAKAASNAYEFFNLLYLFPAFHITYGIGSIAGVFHLVKGKDRR